MHQCMRSMWPYPSGSVIRFTCSCQDFFCASGHSFVPNVMLHTVILTLYTYLQGIQTGNVLYKSNRLKVRH